jgi:hypothetical protein
MKQPLNSENTLHDRRTAGTEKTSNPVIEKVPKKRESRAFIVYFLVNMSVFAQY